MWPNWTRLVLLAAIVCLATIAEVSADGASSKKYKPVFEVKLTPDSGELVADCLRAYRSSTPAVAIQRWEAFLGKYAGDLSIGDLTELTLLRQAHLELMRLYYQQGRVTEADTLLKKAEDYEVFSVPEPAKAQQWCGQNKYCE